MEDVKVLVKKASMKNIHKYLIKHSSDVNEELLKVLL